MLILTKRMRESVKIDDEVTVTVLGIRGAHVRLGFTAPKHVAVHRQEIYELMHGGAPSCNATAESSSGNLPR